MSAREAKRLKPVIFGCSGAELNDREATFFAAHRPLGFILFQRNCRSPEQIRSLTAALRQTAGRPDAPILIDQEGGRVQRLKPPQWRAAPPARTFGQLAAMDRAAAKRAAWINARLIAAELEPLGITIDCAPVLDKPVSGAHDIIGDRAYAADVDTIVELARAAAEGLMDGGILPVIKHIPGHGRAKADSHLECPVVDATGPELDDNDLPPFKALADQPFAMTAHVVYTAWDRKNVATMSPRIVQEVIRERVGFNNVLLSDDLSMKALGGSMADRAQGGLDAGCDILLHCNGELAEMKEIADAVGEIAPQAALRVEKALTSRRLPGPIDPTVLLQELDTLLALVQ